MTDSNKLDATILLVEDLDDDALLIQQSFQRAGLQNPIHRVKTGHEAMAYLAGQVPYHDHDKYPFPGLILLDIKMPGLDGFDTLKWIREQDALKSLCVVMLTSSDEIRDVNLAYQLGANSFLVKPLDFWNAAELTRAVHRLLSKANC